MPETTEPNYVRPNPLQIAMYEVVQAQQDLNDQFTKRKLEALEQVHAEFAPKIQQSLEAGTKQVEATATELRKEFLANPGSFGMTANERAAFDAKIAQFQQSIKQHKHDVTVAVKTAVEVDKAVLKEGAANIKNAAVRLAKEYGVDGASIDVIRAAKADVTPGRFASIGSFKVIEQPDQSDTFYANARIMANPDFQSYNDISTFTKYRDKEGVIKSREAGQSEMSFTVPSDRKTNNGRAFFEIEDIRITRTQYAPTLNPSDIRNIENGFRAALMRDQIEHAIQMSEASMTPINILVAKTDQALQLSPLYLANGFQLDAKDKVIVFDTQKELTRRNQVEKEGFEMIADGRATVLGHIVAADGDAVSYYVAAQPGYAISQKEVFCVRSNGSETRLVDSKTGAFHLTAHQCGVLPKEITYDAQVVLDQAKSPNIRIPVDRSKSAQLCPTADDARKEFDSYKNRPSESAPAPVSDSSLQGALQSMKNPSNSGTATVDEKGNVQRTPPPIPEGADKPAAPKKPKKPSM